MYKKSAPDWANFRLMGNHSTSEVSERSKRT
jgi:hypothetical protein